MGFVQFMAFQTGLGHLQALVGHCSSNRLALSHLPQFWPYPHCGIWIGLVSIWILAFPIERDVVILLALVPRVSLMSILCQLLLVEPQTDLRPWTNLPNGLSVTICWKWLMWTGEIWSSCYCDRFWALKCSFSMFSLNLCHDCSNDTTTSISVPQTAGN